MLGARLKAGRRFGEMNQTDDELRWVASRRIVRRKADGSLECVNDELAREEPLEIRIGQQPLAITMNPPGHDAELVGAFYSPKKSSTRGRTCATFRGAGCRNPCAIFYGSRWLHGRNSTTRPPGVLPRFPRVSDFAAKPALPRSGSDFPPSITPRHRPMATTGRRQSSG